MKTLAWTLAVGVAGLAVGPARAQISPEEFEQLLDQASGLGASATETPAAAVPPVAGRKVAEARPSVRLADIDKAVASGARYLETQQNQDGSWSVGANRHSAGWDNAYIRVGVTHYALGALRMAGGRGDSIERGERYIEAVALQSQEDRRKAGDSFGGNNDRPYALSLGLLSELGRRPADAPERVAPGEAEGRAAHGRRVRGYLDAIDDMALSRPSFVYSDNGGQATFQLGLVAHSLLAARRRGYRLPAGVLEDVLGEIEKGRRKDGSFAYKSDGSGAGKDAEGAAARTVMVEYVLYEAGRSDQERLRSAVELFLKNRPGLEGQLGKDILTHDGAKHGWAKYYYLFGVYWAGLAIEETGHIDAPGLAHELAASVLKLQKADGSWVDSAQATGPSYGTAAAMLALDALRKTFLRHYQAPVRTPEWLADAG